MHKQLENYLNEVAKSLGSLPKTRREEEIREMRQHLLNAVVIGKEQEQSEDESVQIAVEQFGMPQAVSKQIVSAWMRGRTQNRLNFWVTVGLTPVILSMLLFLAAHNGGFFHLVKWSIGVFFLPYSYDTQIGARGFFFLAYGLTGAILGVVVPKQAVRGVGLGVIVYNCAYFTWFGYSPFKSGAFFT